MLKSLNESVYAKAKSIALNNGRQFHLSAIIWRKKRPIAIYTNTFKSHPKCTRFLGPADQGRVSSSMHAEMSAVRFAKPGDVIEVLRWDKDGNLTCSKPCAHCHRALEKAGIKSVTYVDWSGDRQQLKLGSNIYRKVK